MAPPFTRIQTFTTGTPITHAFLNAVQDGYAPASALAMNTRVDCNMIAAILSASISSFTCMIKDEVTLKYTYLTMPATTANSSKNVDTPGSFSNSAWYYVYAVCANGVGRVEITATPPLAGSLVLDTTNTRRYLCCFYVNAGGSIPFLVKNGREYRWVLSDSYFYGAELLVQDFGTTSPVPHNNIPSWCPPTAHTFDVFITMLMGGTGYNLSIEAGSVVQFKQALSSGRGLAAPHRFVVRDPATGAFVTSIYSTASNGSAGNGASYRALGFTE